MKKLRTKLGILNLIRTGSILLAKIIQQLTISLGLNWLTVQFNY